MTLTGLNRVSRKGRRLGVNIWRKDLISGKLRNASQADRIGMVIAAL